MWCINRLHDATCDQVTYEMDGSRPTLANMFTFGDLLSKTIDVQGFSHQASQGTHARRGRGVNALRVSGNHF